MKLLVTRKICQVRYAASFRSVFDLTLYSLKDDGEISFDEFVKVMGNQFFRKYSEAEIKAAFV